MKFYQTQLHSLWPHSRWCVLLSGGAYPLVYILSFQQELIPRSINYLGIVKWWYCNSIIVLAFKEKLPFIYCLATQWYSSHRKGRLDDWFLYLSVFKIMIFFCHPLKVTNIVYSYSFTDLKIFDEFAILIIIEAQTVPNLASGSFFKLAHESVFTWNCWFLVASLLSDLLYISWFRWQSDARDIPCYWACHFFSSFSVLEPGYIWGIPWCLVLLQVLFMFSGITIKLLYFHVGIWEETKVTLP